MLKELKRRICTHGLLIGKGGLRRERGRVEVVFGVDVLELTAKLAL
jgi:hypothetical protein